MELIAITGGIGSGKSVVSRLLRLMGFGVYDTDAHARYLMENSEQLINALKSEFGESIYMGNSIDKQKLASVVFNDLNKLHRLNSIVHPAVISDSLRWANNFEKVAFIETAIPYASGYDKIVSHILKVEAPESVRIARVKLRNGLNESQIKSRIDAQKEEIRPNEKDIIIVNDGNIAVLPQLMTSLITYF